MGDVSFHHGTRVRESNEVPVLIRTVQSAVCCVLGTATNADPLVFPINTPVLIKGTQDASKAKKLGAQGTLKDAIDGIFDQIATYVYVIRVEDGSDYNDTLSNLVGDVSAYTGVHALRKIESLFGRKLKARLVCAPGFTSALATDGIASVSVTAPGSNISANATITVTGGGGQGAELIPLITEGQLSGVAIRKPGWGYTTEPTLTLVDDSGSGATMSSTIGTVGNPVAHELVGLLQESRAVAFIDGPNTTDEAAVSFAGHYGSDRVYVVDPKGLVFDTELDAYVPQPLSARFAGVQARTDRTLGFSNSLSNKPINGIDGVTRPISYGLQTNYLNENGVNTVINRGDGWITWGNRSTTGVSVWKFLNVRRTADFINEALEDAYFEFVDKNPTPANLKFMKESGQSFLDTMQAEDYIIGGRVWFDPEKNSATEAAQGRWVLSVEFEPYAPMENIDIDSHRNIAYYDVLIDTIAENIADGPLALREAA